jgi:hypothetical protein
LTAEYQAPWSAAEHLADTGEGCGHREAEHREQASNLSGPLSCFRKSSSAAGSGHFGSGANSLRQIGDEDGGEQTDTDTVAGGEPDAENHLLRDAIQECAEG